MPRLTPVHWKVLDCIAIQCGFVYKRTKGDHRIYEKEGVNRPIVIQKKEELDVFHIQSLMRTANLTREKYFSLLSKCK